VCHTAGVLEGFAVMAKRLNLKAEWTDSKILRITWNDAVANDQSKMKAIFVGLSSVGLFCWGIYDLFANDGAFLLLFSIVYALVTTIWYRMGGTTVVQQVDFSAENITFKGRTYPTSRVTRFDYGVKSQLTGNRPWVDKHGNSLSDPTMVRMWVDDARPVTISENNWTYEVNHEIRDALDRALKAVQTVEKEKAKEAEFGKTGDFGVPDY
jgi:hypothetical protein